ncbi:hypothetical protein D6853_12115 [Butyrivibrio sp. X503]|uniref:tetratricopeptide repeat protein n=1 Tax=Butyrivibrio sp. X503 TaxID=2364878 RepID=UPI000EA8506D|nr:hypothetical protein [Butyrivibrio sp. X503]RKM54970.1 hypothetical protein D6853_12115 [Butyrivibrio sp. X503]
MDKVEYKIRADEIKALIDENRFAEAVKIADTIDWKRVKSVQMLCMISDLYKINRRFEESRDVLLMAYDRYPTGRAIVYSLCELAIKMGEFVQAVEYYKEFVRIAPRDTGRYILQYKLYEAQEVSLEERIAVLEEFKKHDYREKWVYELAYLYHRVGLTTECIETCDEMFLWLGDGRYVMKALELKALHEPLSPEQQDRYVRYKEKHGGYVDRSIVNDKDEIGKDEPGTVEIKQPTKEMQPVTDEVINAYNNGEAVGEEPAQYAAPTEGVDPVVAAPTQELADSDKIVYPHINEIKEPSVDVSQYNTMNLQKALAEELKGFIDSDDDETDKAEEPAPSEGFEGEVIKPDTAEIYDEEENKSGVFSPMAAVAAEESEGTMQEVFFDASENEAEQTSDAEFKPYKEEASSDDEEEDESLSEENELKEEAKEASFNEEDIDSDDEFEDKEEHKLNIDIKYGGNGPILGEEKRLDYASIPVYEDKPLEEEVPGAVIHPNSNFQMHSHFDNILSQEYDGQISMAVEPEPQVEKQITGQISIAEYMENWEQFKKQQQQKQFEQVKKLVADETGDMFADYDEKTKEGLQEKIEQAISDALKKERHDKASGRGDWSRNNSDVIDDAVAEVISSEGVENTETEEPTEDTEVKTEEVAVEEAKTEEGAVEEAEAKSEDAAEDKKTEEKEATEDKEKSSEDGKESGEKSEESAEDSGKKDGADSKKPSNEGRRNKNRNKKSSNQNRNQNQNQNQNQAQNQDQKKKHHIGNRELDERVRTMTPEEKELFGPYIHHKKSRRQIINAIDNLSMDAYSGNAIVTGEEGAGTVNLAKGLIRAVQASDSNFSGKVAKITANTLNKKSPKAIFEKLANGALIIQRAADLEAETVADFIKVLQQENKGIIVIMEDTKEDINRFLDKNPALKQSFNVRVDIEALDDDSLVAYAKQYALEKEFAIDNLGILALHTKISERQTLDHEVTVSEVRDIIDDAIYYAEKHSVSHLMDIIVNKRYDENDMIILREKDFMH